ncbi:MAG: exopolysaccharide biosynthesis polyprenyl glycosylphosphotransferase [Victivallaceae bacterium]|nr:exopolysaccharide biosynthesis polyprenyl glycosylphosphotransferase [Victivallaceae bacterium]
MKNVNRTAFWRNCFLLTSDLLALAVSVLAALYLYRLFGGKYKMTVFFEFWPFGAAFVAMGIFSRIYGVNFLYGGIAIGPHEELKRITLLIVAAFAFEFTFLALQHDVEAISRVASSLSVFFAIFLVPLFRRFSREVMRKWRLDIPLLVAGGGKSAENLMEMLKFDVFYGLRPIGFLDDDETRVLTGIPRLGGLDDAEAVMRAENVSTLLAVLPFPVLVRMRHRWQESIPQLLIVGDSGGFPISWSRLVDLNGCAALGVINQLQWKFYRILKTVLEVVFCAVAIVLGILPGLLIALLVKLTSRGPVFYYAHRLGKGDKPFYCIKFRTMYQDSDRKLRKLLLENPALKEEWEKNFKLERDPRITPVGRLLRRTSLDELPQLLNVLRGEMALIGPRPIVKKEKPYFGENYRIISQVKPGITGLWQVSGRNNLSYDRRVFLNLYYINNWSIWLDYYIFLATIREIFFPVGAK